jgi:hypothetical protein
MTNQLKDVAEAGYVVFWIGGPNAFGERGTYSKHFKITEMSDALNYMADLRKAGNWYVGMVSQHPDSVGLPGVSDKLPEDYSWSKQHRGSDQEKIKSLAGGRSNL